MSEIHHRFLNQALIEIARARGLVYEEWGQGWLTRVGDGRRSLSTYGYQLSLNSAVAASGARDKAAAVERLERDGVAVVPTRLVLGDVRQAWLDGRRAADVLDQVLADWSPPLIVKPNEGSSGDGVFLCRDRPQVHRRVLELLEREPAVVVQPFLDLVREERWIVLDGAPRMRYTKTPGAPDGAGRRAPLFNLALGATVGEFGLEGARPGTRELALAAAGSLGLRVAAVDLVHGVDGSCRVLEVNSGLSFEHLVRLEPSCRTEAVAVYDAAVTAAMSGGADRVGGCRGADRGWPATPVGADGRPRRMSDPGPVDRLRGGWRPGSAAEALEFLQVDLVQAPEGLFRGGDGWARSAALLAELGDPQDAVPVVHVAGTAGKGTVAAGVAAVATRPGCRVGLHLSPHVYDLRERFSVDGSWCSPGQVADLLAAVLPAARRLADSPHGPPTYYEVTLAMALVHFVRQRCDLVVLETGLGGRFDGTNTVTRADKLAVITRIDLDHEAVLGHTLEAIADQKAGILTPGGEAVVLHHGVAAIDDTLAAAAAAVGCRCHLVGAPVAARGAVGHLVEDAALVQAAVAVLDARQGRPSDAAAVARVMSGVTLPGRFERVRTPEGAEAVLDGAHNPVKLAALIDRLRAERPSAPDPRWPWVFGCRRDKKAPAMLAMLAEVVDQDHGLVLVQFPVAAGDVPADVSADPRELATLARAAGIDRVAVASLDDAADRIRTGTGGGVTVVAGSFHLLAALRPRLLARSRAGPRSGA